MKIAYLLGSLSRGGTETLVLDVFKNEDKAGFEFIGVHRKDGSLKDDFYTTNPLFVKCEQKKWNIIVYLIRLRRILVRNSITIVHAQQILDAMFAYVACIGTGIKVIETFHGHDFKAGKFNRWLIKKSLDWCEKVIFVSDYLKKYYITRYGQKYIDKCVVVYNGIFFDKIKLRSSINYISPDFVRTGKLQFGSVGNFIPGRNQISLCKFLHLLDKEGVDFKFYFVGRRNDKEPWRFDDCVRYCQENGLSDKVEFMGARSDVPELLAQWDAFLYSSDHDTFGIAVVEAIASGLPTFVNDWDVMREITDNGKLAHLYKTKDPSDLLRVFKDFLQNKAAYEREAIDNAKVIREKFSIEKHLEALSRVYDGVS